MNCTGNSLSVATFGLSLYTMSLTAVGCVLVWLTSCSVLSLYVIVGVTLVLCLNDSVTSGNVVTLDTANVPSWTFDDRWFMIPVVLCLNDSVTSGNVVTLDTANVPSWTSDDRWIVVPITDTLRVSS